MKDSSCSEDQSSRARSPSPQPVEPVPSVTQFVRLPIRAQFAYVKPVLTAILNEHYAPAKERHDNFIKKGASTSINNITLGGSMSENQVKKMEKCLAKWVLGDAYWTVKRKPKNGGSKKMGGGSRHLVHSLPMRYRMYIDL
jgi:hypothetical protein